MNTESDGVPQQNNGQRIDLIKFYNTVFVQVVKDNALKYSSNSVRYNTLNIYLLKINLIFIFLIRMII